MTTENQNMENENVENSENLMNSESTENNTSSTDEKQQEEAFKKLSLEETVDKMEKIINLDDISKFIKDFNQLKDHAFGIINEEIKKIKEKFLSEEGNEEEDFSYTHPIQSKLSGILSIFKGKYDEFHKAQEAEQEKNLEERKSIIERLKNLYMNSSPDVNLFKEIRAIKESWSNAGKVAKSEFKLLNNNYFHHLNQFYAMLDLNKEYLAQEYEHNLEKRHHMIERAKELLTEESIQKALNELQYLHKLWKEEAVPVAEEFREKTWEEFKELSNKIHDRKAELNAQMEAEKKQNLVRKNEIIEEMKKITSPEKEVNHNYWQNAIKKIESLRNEFIQMGSVPKPLSNQNWTEFKETLRNFNKAKNNFYKGLKNVQQENLEKKLRLIETAKDNMNGNDWDTLVPLFKNLQKDWKKIGHVPRNQANKIWDEFKNACNTFFDNYREKNDIEEDNWKNNYEKKKHLLEDLKKLSENNGIEKLEEIKNQWNAIGKVPRDKMNIHSDFNKVFKEKLRLNNVTEFDLNEEGLSEAQITDKARKVKKQIADIEAEISKLENNLAFVSNPSRDNPLLAETYSRIDDKKEQLDNLKNSLHNLIANNDSNND